MIPKYNINLSIFRQFDRLHKKFDDKQNKHLSDKTIPVKNRIRLQNRTTESDM